jgi:hypothetical protein
MKKKSQKINFLEHSPIFKLVKRWVEEAGKYEKNNRRKI